MNILITIDDNYIEAAFDMLFSLKLYNKNLVIHVVYDNLSKQSINRLQDFVKYNNVGELKLYYFNSKDLKLDVINSLYITNTCYFRLFAPYIIEDVDRILYLDPDIVCQGKIDELYNVDLKDNILAACPNMLREEVEYLRVLMLRSIKLPIDADYVNSGVLLIDMKKYREFMTLEYLTNFLEKNSKHLQYQDQDTVNKLFYKKIKIMDNKFNYQINAVDWWKVNIKKTIVHYSEAKKPWKYYYTEPYRAIPYYKLLFLKGENERLKKLMNSHALCNASDTLDKLKNGIL